MGISASFDALQETVNADVAIVDLARERRDVFKAALSSAPDVTAVWGSGSLARSTQLQPVHDVDLVVEFDEAAHPSWGGAGDSADEAIERCRELVNDRLSVNGGSYAQLVRQVRTADRNRAAKCFIDPPEADDAFTVDVMPALRRADGILIPMKRESRWSLADPEYLISEVAARQSEWDQFRPLVRLLKYWSKQSRTETGRVKSLVMEVLALECLPKAGNRPEALRAFFSAASTHSLAVSDPAGLSGIVQPDLEVARFRRALEDAASDANAAARAVADNNQARASIHWRAIFGDAFPLIAGVGGAAEEDGPRPVRDSPQG